jgi:hypothetical protein
MPVPSGKLAAGAKLQTLACSPWSDDLSHGGNMKVQLVRNVVGTFLLVAEDGRDILIQSDWDYPGIASTFGWVPCFCGRTDGTVDCTHRTRSEMMAEAWDFLSGHIGMEVNDPGYFAE